MKNSRKKVAVRIQEEERKLKEEKLKELKKKKCYERRWKIEGRELQQESEKIIETQ